LITGYKHWFLTHIFVWGS